MFLLSFEKKNAVENMSKDIEMLDFWTHKNVPRLRFYGWENKAYTYGISQKAEDFRFIGSEYELEKRPSGGGLVNHENDITYALVVPRGYVLAEMNALESYKVVHECIVRVCKFFGIDSCLCEESVKSEGVAICFVHPAKYDAMTVSGLKIAGAAQKRNRNGLLFQGSIDKGILGAISHDKFRYELGNEFAKMFNEDIEYL